MHCHAFTLAVAKICNGGGEAMVRTNDSGDVSHSVYRLPNTSIFVDETGQVTLDKIPGMSWRRAPIEEISKMATGKRMRRKALAVLAEVQ